jgi:hypothetical protein
MSGCGSADIQLALKGCTDYTIVQSSTATEAERYAVQELAEHLSLVTGATYRVATDSSNVTGPRILVGPSEASGVLLGAEIVKSLGPEEFIIKAVGRDLVLVGGRPRGSLYAVYHFLDNVVGIRWWAPEATTIPHKPSLSIGTLNIRQKPVFEYRDPYLNVATNGDWAARNRITPKYVLKTDRDGKDTLSYIHDDKHGGSVSYGKSYFCHTFDVFIPSKVYFDAHPDWFPLIDGKRVKGYFQLCLSNPEVVDFMVTQVKAALKNDPGMSIVSVSQNDAQGACECPNCKKIEDEEGSPSGLMLRFVNAVAEQIEKDYPDVVIQTLAYTYTRQPPKHVRARRNVSVLLCDIESSFAQPLDTAASDENVSLDLGARNQQFATELRNWAKIADNIYIWDYIANFGNYFRPHPNLHVLGPNLRFFASNNVKGVFEQGSHETPSGEMAELRAWVLSRLLWNPNQDDRALIDEFISGYYDRAAPFIRDYVALIHDAVEKNTYYMGISASDPSPYVTAETMSRAEVLFRKAEVAVAAQPDVLARVRRARMPVQCMWLLHYDEWVKPANQQANFEPVSFQTILDDFSKQVDADKVTRSSERNLMSNFLNLLKNREAVATATASGSYGAGIPYDVFYENRTLGKSAQNWSAGGFGPQWIQKDMQNVVKLKAIRTDFGAMYVNVDYKIDGSLDGETWFPLVGGKNTTTSKGEDIFSPSIETRFIKTTILKGGTRKNPNEWVGMSKQRMEVE